MATSTQLLPFQTPVQSPLFSYTHPETCTTSSHVTPAVTFDESAVGDLAECKIAVLDVDKEWGDKWGAGNCNLNDPRTWPFNAPGKGIDGHDALPPEHYQYSMEYWIAQVGSKQAQVGEPGYAGRVAGQAGRFAGA